MKFDYKRMLKKELNVGSKEKQIRLIAGLGLILISIPLAKIILLIVGLILVATGYVGWCPINSGFGRNSYETEQTKPD